MTPAQHASSRARVIAASGLTGFSASLAGWLVVTLLAALGLIVAVLVIGTNFSSVELARQLANLAQHYLAAEPARRRAFDHGAQFAFIASAGLIALIRRGSLPSFSANLARGDMQ